MFTKYSLVAFLAVASMIATSNDVFAAGKCHRIRHNKCCCCVTADPCAPATAAAPDAVAMTEGTTYRSFSVEPSAPAPIYRASAPSRTPTYLLPKMDPRKHSGSW